MKKRTRPHLLTTIAIFINLINQIFPSIVIYFVVLPGKTPVHQAFISHSYLHHTSSTTMDYIKKAIWGPDPKEQVRSSNTIHIHHFLTQR